MIIGRGRFSAVCGAWIFTTKIKSKGMCGLDFKIEKLQFPVFQIIKYQVTDLRNFYLGFGYHRIGSDTYKGRQKMQ